MGFRKGLGRQAREDPEAADSHRDQRAESQQPFKKILEPKLGGLHVHFCFSISSLGSQHVSETPTPSDAPSGNRRLQRGLSIPVRVEMHDCPPGTLALLICISVLNALIIATRPAMNY